jgi:hypothetical protein
MLNELLQTFFPEKMEISCWVSGWSFLLWFLRIKTIQYNMNGRSHQSVHWVSSSPDASRAKPSPRRDFPMAGRTKPRPTPGRDGSEHTQPPGPAHTLLSVKPNQKTELTKCKTYNNHIPTLTPDWRTSNMILCMCVCIYSHTHSFQPSDRHRSTHLSH